jgi:DNA-binding MarR family transcriptional regulator
MGADDEQFRALMLAMLRLIADSTKAIAEAFDPIWVGILRLTVTDGPKCVVEIEEALDANPSAVNRQVRALAEDGSVTIRQEGTDRRFWLVSATQAGADELRQIDDIAVDFLRAVIGSWSADDVRNLTAQLKRLSGDWYEFKASNAHRVRRPAP